MCSVPAFSQFSGPYPSTNPIVQDDGTTVSGSGRTLNFDTGITAVYNSSTKAYKITGNPNLIVQQDDVTSGTSSDTIDFNNDFTLTQSPSNETNVNLSNTGVTAGTYGVHGATISSRGRVTNAWALGLTGLNDVGSSTATAGRLLVADGTKFQSVGVSGDCTITSAGAITCASAGLFADAGTNTYLTSTTDNFAIGGTAQNSAFYVDATNNLINVGKGTTSNGTAIFNASTGLAGRLSYDTDGSFLLTGSTSTYINLQNNGELRLSETAENGPFYVALKAPSTLFSNATFTLPSTPSAGFLTSDGLGVLSFTASTLTGLSDVGSATITAGRLLIADGTKFQSKAVSGDITITSAGVTAIGTGLVGPTQIASTSVNAGTYSATSLTVDADGRITNAFSSGLTGLSDVGSSTVGAGRLLINDGTKFQSVSMNQHCFIQSNGAINCNGGGWAKTLTGLSDVGSATISAGRMLIADGTKYQSVSLSGDCTISSAGVVTCSIVGSQFSTSGTNIYLTDTTKNLIAGGTTLEAPFSVNVGENTVRVGNSGSTDGELQLYSKLDSGHKFKMETYYGLDANGHDALQWWGDPGAQFNRLQIHEEYNPTGYPSLEFWTADGYVDMGLENATQDFYIEEDQVGKRILILFDHIYLGGPTEIVGDTTITSGNSSGQCSLSGAATATCTHTVPSGCIPVCIYNSSSLPHIVACSVTATTLTAVSATSLDSGVVNYHCF